jgi:putative ABC transport system permease protein
MLDTLRQDLGYAWRGLTRTPTLSLVAVATLALGIGANSAIFSVVNAVLVRPLPFRDADRLVRLTGDFTALNAADIGMSPPELWDYRDSSGLFDGIAGVWAINANLTEVDEPERVEVLLASPSYFDVLGARPQLGRLFTPGDNAPGITEVVVISDRLWKRRFGGAPDVLGRTLRIDDDSYKVVGVLPPGFRHPGRSVLTDVDMWAPANFSASPFPSPAPRGGYFITGAIARLKPGITISEAQQRLAAFGAQIRAAHPNDYPARTGWQPRMIALQDDLVGSVRPVLIVTFSAVGLVLLIACANIANLLIARASSRQREFAVRRALGATRMRLARLLLTESAVIAAAGGLAAALVTGWLLAGLLSLAPDGLPRMTEVAVDGRVLVFTALVACATAVLSGTIPAIQFSRGPVNETLKEFGRGATRTRGTMRSLLVVGEFALALLLLVGAALLIRSFWRLQQLDPGFNPDRVLTARLWLPQPNDPSSGRYFKHPARLALFEEILRRARTLPRVSDAAIASWLPLDGTRTNTTITVEGEETTGAGRAPAVQSGFASAGYFELMQMHVVAGRTFGPQDDSRAQPVVVITRAMAQRYWPGVDPVGKRLHIGGPQASNPWMTVIGVVNDVRAERLEDAARPVMFRPLTQVSNLAVSLVLKTDGDAEVLGPALAREIRATDTDLPAYGVRTMQQIVDRATASRRFVTRMVTGFAALALVLAAVGVYGVIAFLVGQRTREIGVQIALGARPHRVVRTVVFEALRWAGIGIAIGAVLAVPLTRLLRGLLFEIQPTDPISYGVIALVLAATATVAAWRPAARAARLDPMIALRGE